MHFKYTILALTIFLLSCSTSRSLVVLLPDSDGKVGQVEVSTDKGTQRIGQAYHSIRIGASEEVPSTPAPIEQQKITEVFGQALAAQPDPRFRIWTATLYCKNGSVELLENSQKALSEIIKDFKKHSPVEVYVIGHADRVGSEKHNLNLSQRRSAWIKEKFIVGGVKSRIVLIASFGELRPRVYTDDEIPEPLNRRVELVAKFHKL